MAERVLWFRLKVGMFDGESFKKIKRAKIGGVSYRDKLTAVWVELLDLAAKSNSSGYLIDSNGVPYQLYNEIATMIDREDKEVELCMQFFLNEKMIETSNDIYCITNFMQYQNQEGLDKIREQNRIRQANYRERQKALAPSHCDTSVTRNVTSRESNETRIKNIELELESYNTTPIENILLVNTCARTREDSQIERRSTWISQINEHLRKNCHLSFYLNQLNENVKSNPKLQIHIDAFNTVLEMLCSPLNESDVKAVLQFTEDKFIKLINKFISQFADRTEIEKARGYVWTSVYNAIKENSDNGN